MTKECKQKRVDNKCHGLYEKGLVMSINNGIEITVTLTFMFSIVMETIWYVL